MSRMSCFLFLFSLLLIPGFASQQELNAEAHDPSKNLNKATKVYAELEIEFTRPGVRPTYKKISFSQFPPRVYPNRKQKVIQIPDLQKVKANRALRNSGRLGLTMVSEPVYYITYKVKNTTDKDPKFDINGKKGVDIIFRPFIFIELDTKMLKNEQGKKSGRFKRYYQSYDPAVTKKIIDRFRAGRRRQWTDIPDYKDLSDLYPRVYKYTKLNPVEKKFSYTSNFGVKYIPNDNLFDIDPVTKEIDNVFGVRQLEALPADGNGKVESYVIKPGEEIHCIATFNFRMFDNVKHIKQFEGQDPNSTVNTADDYTNYLNGLLVDYKKAKDFKDKFLIPKAWIFENNDKSKGDAAENKKRNFRIKGYNIGGSKEYIRLKDYNLDSTFDPDWHEMKIYIMGLYAGGSENGEGDLQWDPHHGKITNPLDKDAVAVKFDKTRPVLKRMKALRLIYKRYSSSSNNLNAPIFLEDMRNLYLDTSLKEIPKAKE